MGVGRSMFGKCGGPVSCRWGWMAQFGALTDEPGNSVSVRLVAAQAISSPAVRPDVGRFEKGEFHTNHKDRCVSSRLVFLFSLFFFFERSDSSVEASRRLHDIRK